MIPWCISFFRTSLKIVIFYRGYPKHTVYMLKSIIFPENLNIQSERYLELSATLKTYLQNVIHGFK